MTEQDPGEGEDAFQTITETVSDIVCGELECKFSPILQRILRSTLTRKMGSEPANMS